MKNTEIFQMVKVKEVQVENPTSRTLICDEILPDAQPGQYVMAWLPGVGEKPFSIAHSNPLTITVAAVGPVSQALCGLKPEERLWVRGPLGQGFQLAGKKHLLVGGGYGAAPLLFLSRQAIEKGQQVCACLGARSQQELVLVEKFRSAGCDVGLCTEDGSCGEQGLATHIAEQAIQDFNPDCLYACGPHAMLLALGELCKVKKLPAQLSWEALLRCGIGLCGSCELDQETRCQAGLPAGWLVCKDGPVSSFHPQ